MEPTKYVDIEETSTVEVIPDISQNISPSADVATESRQPKKLRKEKQAKRSDSKPLKLLESISYRCTLFVCGMMPGIAQFMLGFYETAVTVIGPKEFDWSTTVVGLFLSAIASLVIPLSWGDLKTERHSGR